MPNSFLSDMPSGNCFSFLQKKSLDANKPSSTHFATYAYKTLAQPYSSQKYFKYNHIGIW